MVVVVVVDVAVVAVASTVEETWARWCVQRDNRAADMWSSCLSIKGGTVVVVVEAVTKFVVQQR